MLATSASSRAARAPAAGSLRSARARCSLVPPVARRPRASAVLPSCALASDRPTSSSPSAGGSGGLGGNAAARALLESGPMSIDPMASKKGDEHAPGKPHLVHSPEEFAALRDAEDDRLVVLMCKAKSCRPCKMFSRKYQRVAERHPEVVFLEMFGDESSDTRKLMIAEEVRVTPTFLWYRKGERVKSHTGVNENKLVEALQELCKECTFVES